MTTQSLRALDDNLAREFTEIKQKRAKLEREIAEIDITLKRIVSIAQAGDISLVEPEPLRPLGVLDLGEAT